MNTSLMPLYYRIVFCFRSLQKSNHDDVSSVFLADYAVISVPGVLIVHCVFGLLFIATNNTVLMDTTLGLERIGLTNDTANFRKNYMVFRVS